MKGDLQVTIEKILKCNEKNADVFENVWLESTFNLDNGPMACPYDEGIL